MRTPLSSSCQLELGVVLRHLGLSSYKRSVSYTNIEDLVSPWDLITSGSIYSQKKRIEESFTMVIEANDYVKQFLRYWQFSVW